MSSIVDYHMHTPLCGHAQGTPAEYAQHAIKLGLKEIGFSDHAPLLSHRDPGVTMDFDQLPEYLAMIEQVREGFSEILSIKIGIEADFLAGYEDQTRALLKKYPYDYVLGSVHFIDSWAFDDPAEKQGWDHKDTNKTYQEYYDHIRRCALSGLFDIMAHVDLVKKFGHRASVNMEPIIRETADAFKQAGIAIEINTAGLRKPVAEIYPDLSSLRIYCEAGIPVTFGSDAHAPNQVGMDFDKAWALAKAAGYKSYCLFKNRQIEKELPIP